MPVPPTVVLRTPDGRVHRLHPGGLVGRLATAALRVEHPRISEAHAMVSLRGRQLVLLGLRGALCVRGRWVRDAVLEPGTRLGLAEDYQVVVDDVVLPQRVLALDGLGHGRVELDRPELSLYAAPPRVAPGASLDADAVVWCTGGVWRYQLRGGEPAPLSDFTLGAQSVRIVEVPLSGTPKTSTAAKRTPPLSVVVWPGHTEITASGRRPVKLTRNAHAIVQAVAEVTGGRGSAHWQQVADLVWRVNATEDNWFTNHRRLRERLVRHGLPEDLVACEDGQVSLRLRSEVDRLEIVDG